MRRKRQKSARSTPGSHDLEHIAIIKLDIVNNLFGLTLILMYWPVEIWQNADMSCAISLMFQALSEASFKTISTSIHALILSWNNIFCRLSTLFCYFYTWPGQELREFNWSLCLCIYVFFFSVKISLVKFKWWIFKNIMIHTMLWLKYYFWFRSKKKSSQPNQSTALVLRLLCVLQ